MENIELSSLLIHSYASILTLNNVSTSIPNGNTNGNIGMTSNSSSQNENLMRAITPQIVDYLFKVFYEETDKFYDQYNEEIGEQMKKQIFYDKKLIVCRCLPLLVNILHLSLPDKRQVDMSVVLEKCFIALDVVKRGDIKLELIKSYHSMINDCSDKAALRIVLASSRFFTCLLDQCRNISAGVKNDVYSKEFLHRFLVRSLRLIRDLLDGSDTVKVGFIHLK